MLPALALIAGSTFLKHQNERQVLRRRQALGRAMEAYQRGKAREGQAATEQLLQTQTPEARQQELGEVTADRAQSMRDTVGAAQAFDAPAIAGKTSGDYAKAQEAQADSTAAKVRRAIEQLSVTGAPGEQGQKHAVRFGRAAGAVRGANLASEKVGDAYATDMDNVQGDPFLGLVSQIARGAGQGLLLRGMDDAVVDAGVNNGQGYEDASGNLYDEGVATRQDARIQRALQLKRAFSLWGG